MLTSNTEGRIRELAFLGDDIFRSLAVSEPSYGQDVCCPKVHSYLQVRWRGSDEVPTTAWGFGSSSAWRIPGLPHSRRPHDG